MNSEFFGNGDLGGTEDIHKSMLKFYGLEKRWEKISGEKKKHFPAMFSRQVQNANRFPWIFPNMTFLFENYILFLKKKIRMCKGKAVKGGVKCPRKETKPATELKQTVTS